MTTHVTNGTIYKADPAAPTKRWLLTAIAESDQVAVHDAQPKMAQPFRFANGSVLADFVVGAKYWMRGTADDGNRVWRLTLTEVRAAGQDVMLVGNLT